MTFVLRMGNSLGHRCVMHKWLVYGKLYSRDFLTLTIFLFLSKLLFSFSPNSNLAHIIFMVDMPTMVYIHSTCLCVYIHVKSHFLSSVSRLHTVTTVRKSSAVLEIHQEV